MGHRIFVSYSIFILLFSFKLCFYSEGIHRSLGASDSLGHYTVFAFEKKGGKLEQCWSLHINEDGCLSWVHSRKRRIFWNSVTHLFVRNFFLFFTNYSQVIEYLFFRADSDFIATRSHAFI